MFRTLTVALACFALLSPSCAPADCQPSPAQTLAQLTATPGLHLRPYAGGVGLVPQGGCPRLSGDGLRAAINGQSLTLTQAGGRSWHEPVGLLAAPASCSCETPMLGGGATSTDLNGQTLEYRVEQGAVVLSATYVDLQNDLQLKELAAPTSPSGTRLFRFVTASGHAYQLERPASFSSAQPVVTVTGVVNGTRQPADFRVNGTDLWVLPSGPTQQLHITTQALSYDVAASTCAGGVPCEDLPVFARDGDFLP